MKKLKTLGIISAVFLVLVIAVFAVLAAVGIFKIETDEEGNSNIIFSPVGTENEFIKWQTSETEGDITAVFKTEEGKFEVKLSSSAAAEKFIELDNAGTFDKAEFSVLAENMFIQTSPSGESFSSEKNEFALLNGAVGFVFENGEASPSLVIITAKELSGISKAFLSESGFDEERISAYKNFGGVPELEEKVLVFGMVVSGFDVIEDIKNGKNSGYTGGFSAIEPVKIKSVEINFPTEEN